jgi:hypothetical protein
MSDEVVESVEKKKKPAADKPKDRWMVRNTSSSHGTFYKGTQQFSIAGRSKMVVEFVPEMPSSKLIVSKIAAKQ